MDAAENIEDGSKLVGNAPSKRDAPVAYALDGLTPLQTLRVLLLPYYLNVLLCQLARSLVVVALPLHLLNIGGSSIDVGNLVAAYGLGYTLANVPGGILIAYIGPKGILLTSCTLFEISAVLCIFSGAEDAAVMAKSNASVEVVEAEALISATGVETYLFLRLVLAAFLLGCATNLSVFAQQTFAGNQVPSGRRGLVLSTMGGMARGSWALGPFIGGQLQEHFGVSAVFFAQSVVAAAAALSVITFMPWLSCKEPQTGGNTGLADAAKNIFAHYAKLCRIMGLVAALQFVRKAREFFFSLTGKQIGLTASAIGQIAALSFIVDMLGFPISGRIMDAHGRRIAAGLSIFLQSCGILALVIKSPEAVVVSGIITGLGNGLSSGLLMTLGVDLSPSGNARGPFLAVYRVMANSAEFTAPLLLGALAHVGSPTFAAIASSTVGFLGIAWMLVAVPETRDQSLTPSQVAVSETAKMIVPAATMVGVTNAKA